MKTLLISILITATISSAAQVGTMGRLPAGNTSNASIQAPAAALQSPASLMVSVLTCTEQNLAEEYVPVTNFEPNRKYYSAVILDNPLTNNNPAAVIIVIPVRYQPVPFSLFYDKAIGKWKIRIEHNGSDDRDRMTGIASPSSPKLAGTRQVEVIPYAPQSLQPGDKFNILVNQ